MKIIFLFFFTLQLYAHQTGLSFIEITQHNSKNIAITYKKPLSDTRSGDIAIIFPSSCIYTHPFTTTIFNGFIIKKTTMQCINEEGLENKKIWIKGLVKSDRGVLIYFKNEKNNFEKKSILRSDAPFISLTTKTSTITIISQYILLGIEHILTGYDHLLFVTLLVLLATTLRQLFFTVTAFTLAHSITLTCSIFDIIYLPPPFVEMMIALSIILLAKDLYINTQTISKKFLPLSAFSFGLLHGFGFSSALKDIGLPQDSIPLALFSFNIGIELGQILYIISFLSIKYIIERFIGFSFQKRKHSLAIIIGSLASFWFWQRFIGSFF